MPEEEKKFDALFRQSQHPAGLAQYEQCAAPQGGFSAQV
jgi:hypothetical protein